MHALVDRITGQVLWLIADPQLAEAAVVSEQHDLVADASIARWLWYVRPHGIGPRRWAGYQAEIKRLVHDRIVDEMIREGWWLLQEYSEAGEPPRS